MIETPAREGAMGIRGVIFDLDGTLADTIPVCLSAFRSAFERYSGRRWDEEEIEALFGPTEEGSCRRAVPNHWQGCLEAYEKAHADLTEPFPGIIDALRLLRERGVSAAVVTGKGPRLLIVNNTLHLEELWVAEALLEEFSDREDVEAVGEPFPLEFDSGGHLVL